MIYLTPRDLELLKLLLEHCLLSLNQIHNYLFMNKDISTVLNRIKKLEDHHLLKRHKVNRISHPAFNHDIGTIILPTQKTIDTFLRQNPVFHVQPKIIKIYNKQLDHELLLTHTIENLKKELPDYNYINGHYLSLDKKEHLPDGVMIHSLTQEKIAIELELTTKSTHRYKEIFRNYKLSSRYQKVIYFTLSPAMTLKMMSEIKGYNVPRLDDFYDNYFDFRLIEITTHPTNKTQNQVLI